MSKNGKHLLWANQPCKRSGRPVSCWIRDLSIEKSLRELFPGKDFSAQVWIANLASVGDYNSMDLVDAWTGFHNGVFQEILF